LHIANSNETIITDNKSRTINIDFARPPCCFTVYRNYRNALRVFVEGVLPHETLEMGASVAATSEVRRLVPITEKLKVDIRIKEINKMTNRRKGIQRNKEEPRDTAK